jgi:hypothetical protein
MTFLKRVYTRVLILNASFFFYLFLFRKKNASTKYMKKKKIIKKKKKRNFNLILKLNKRSNIYLSLLIQ